MPGPDTGVGHELLMKCLFEGCVDGVDFLKSYEMRMWLPQKAHERRSGGNIVGFAKAIAIERAKFESVVF